MLTIRLSRQGRKKRAFYRVVLTEHTKPAKSWYQDVLGRFDPITHKQEINIELAKERILKWAKPSERVAKLMYNETKDKFFNKYFEQRTREGKKKKEWEAA